MHTNVTLMCFYFYSIKIYICFCLSKNKSMLFHCSRAIYADIASDFYFPPLYPSIIEESSNTAPLKRVISKCSTHISSIVLMHACVAEAFIIQLHAKYENIKNDTRNLNSDSISKNLVLKFEENLFSDIMLIF